MTINEEKLKKYIKMGCDSSEKELSFRQRVFNKILEVLGWTEEQIEYEKEIPVGSGRTLSADYELTLRGEKYIVEAKSPRVDVVNYYDQLTSYIKQEEAKLGFIYNGKKLVLFVRNFENDWSHTPAYVWECGQDLDLFFYLSTEKIETLVDDFLVRTQNDRLLDKAIKDKILEIKNDVIDILRSATNLSPDYIQGNIDITLRSPRIQVSSSTTNSTGSDGEAPENNRVAQISNEEIPGDDNDVVVVCPASGEQNDNTGERWMLKYNAWRSIVMKTKSPKYMALYQGFPYSKVRWFAEIEKIFDSEDPILQREYGLTPIGNSDIGKKTLILKHESIKLLEEPIEKASWGGLRNIKYTTVGKMKHARSIEDL
jgi:hypothetical protein